MTSRNLFKKNRTVATGKDEVSRPGFTLVEVIASIGLCVLLFSMVYGGFSTHRNQVLRAGTIVQCTEKLDHLLASWSEQNSNEKIPSNGWLAESESLKWQIQPISTPLDLSELGIQKYRLEAQDKNGLVCFLEILWERDQMLASRPFEKYPLAGPSANLSTVEN